MNVPLGLRRLSAVWWGLWIAGGLVGAVGFCVSGNFIDAAGTLLLAAVAFGLHRLTCWIIDGFSSPRS